MVLEKLSTATLKREEQGLDNAPGHLVRRDPRNGSGFVHDVPLCVVRSVSSSAIPRWLLSAPFTSKSTAASSAASPPGLAVSRLHAPPCSPPITATRFVAVISPSATCAGCPSLYPPVAVVVIVDRCVLCRIPTGSAAASILFVFMPTSPQPLAAAANATDAATADSPPSSLSLPHCNEITALADFGANSHHMPAGTRCSARIHSSGEGQADGGSECDQEDGAVSGGGRVGGAESRVAAATVISAWREGGAGGFAHAVPPTPGIDRDSEDVSVVIGVSLRGGNRVVAQRSEEGNICRGSTKIRGVGPARGKAVVHEAVKAGRKQRQRMSDFPRPTYYYGSVIDFHDGLVDDSDAWRRQRRVVAPQFSDRNNSFVLAETVRFAKSMFQDWETAASASTASGKTAFEVPITADMSRFALKLICSAGFGFEYDAYVEAADADARDPDVTANGSLLDALIKASSSPGACEGGALSEEEIYGNILLIFQAGHITTSVTLNSAILLLASDPAAQDRLHDEAAAVFGSLEDASCASLRDLRRLPFALAVMNETLRLHPAVTNTAAWTADSDPSSPWATLPSHNAPTSTLPSAPSIGTLTAGFT
ncbi:Eukaryotic translation initiation factor 2 alpha kinase 4 [Cladochytrium tenue]|nr:Eukaryotic translation initiation factor 2 alpha kinase 4 [Cladochytrium tenue]